MSFLRKEIKHAFALQNKNIVQIALARFELALPGSEPDVLDH